VREPGGLKAAENQARAGVLSHHVGKAAGPGHFLPQPGGDVALIDDSVQYYSRTYSGADPRIPIFRTIRVDRRRCEHRGFQNHEIEFEYTCLRQDPDCLLPT